MGFHHVALATRDTAATHEFYTTVMGFELVKVVTSPTPGEHGGWSKHFFYDTSGAVGGSGDSGMIAFWEIHDDQIGDTFPVDINTTAGLPWWVNHIAFDASLDQLGPFTERWLRTGRDVVEVDHGFCRSIYTEDPNGNTVEWCADVRAFTDEDRAEAAAALADPNPPFETPPMPTFHLAAEYAAANGEPVGS